MSPRMRRICSPSVSKKIEHFGTGWFQPVFFACTRKSPAGGFPQAARKKSESVRTGEPEGRPCRRTPDGDSASLPRGTEEPAAVRFA